VAEPARRGPQEAPPLDPDAVARAYRLERAKRRARHARERARRRATLRFLGVLVVLLVLAVVLGATAWQQIQRLFGL
jgi:cell division septal protein FtsQ